MENRSRLDILIVLIIILSSLLVIGFVQGASSDEISNLNLILDKNIFQPSEKIIINIDNHDLFSQDLSKEIDLVVTSETSSYKYLGEIVFPLEYQTSKPGKYTFLIKDKNNKNLISEKSFEISNEHVLTTESQEETNVCSVVDFKNIFPSVSTKPHITMYFNNYDEEIYENLEVYLVIENGDTKFKSLDITDALKFYPPNLGDYKISLYCGEELINSVSFGYHSENSLSLPAFGYVGNPKSNSSTSFLASFVKKVSDDVGNSKQEVSFELLPDSSVDIFELENAYIIDFFNKDREIIESSNTYLTSDYPGSKQIKIDIGNIKSVVNPIAKYVVDGINKINYPAQLEFYYNGQRQIITAIENYEIKKITMTSSNGQQNKVDMQITNTQRYQDKEIATVVFDIENNGFNKKSLKLNSLDITNLQNLNLKYEEIDVDEIKISGKSVLDSYAMDLSNLNFTNGTYTKTAKGNELWKCKDWDYDTQSCLGVWNKIMKLIPGQQYEFEVSSVDPGYAETGVASINTKKSIYHPDETAEIIIVVLDNRGYLVRDANIVVKITNPNNVDLFYYTNTSIIETSQGIYEFNYPNTSLEGNYSMSIIATGEDVNSTMYSYFTVQNYFEFDIIRNTPVTMDPWKENLYSEFKIINYGNESTFDFREILPANFTIINSGNASITKTNESTTLLWQDLTNNSIISYTAIVPLITPELYALRSMINYGVKIFEEARPWFLAIDPILDISQVAQIYQTGVNDDVDTEVSINFDQETILQSNFSHPQNSILSFSNAGWYKISYNCLYRETGTSNRRIVTTWLADSNGGEIHPSRTYCYVRQTGDEGDRCSNQGVSLVNIFAGGNVTLQSSTVGTGTGDDILTEESCWIYAEKLNRPATQIYEISNYDDTLTTGTPIIQDFEATTYVETDNFTVDLANNWITVDQDGWYKIYYSVSSQIVNSTDDNQRKTPSAYLYLNNNAEIQPSQTYSYHKRADQAPYSTEQAFTMAYLSSGDNISVRRYLIQDQDSLYLTQTINDSWLLVEKIIDDVLVLWDTGTAQTVVPSNEGGLGVNVTWDTEESDGSNFTHAPSSSVFTIDETGLYEISYGVGWDDNGGGRHVGCATLLQDGTPVEPSQQCDYSRGSNNNNNYNSVVGNLIINNTAGQEYALYFEITSDGTTSTNPNLEPDSSWITVMPVQIMNFINGIPTQSTPIINSSSAGNTTDENLTCYNQSTFDADGHSVKNIYNWYINGTSFQVLNMPFEGGSNSTYTKDYSYNNNDGTVSAATWNSTGGYDVKGAYEFDGSSTVIDVNGIGNGISIHNSDNYTIMMWVKGASNQADKRIFSEGNTASNNPLFNIGTNAGGQKLDIYIRDDDNTARINHVLSTADVFDDTWHHIAWVDSGGNYQIYVDGDADISGSYTKVAKTLDTTTIGAIRRSTLGYYYEGYIDEVQIFNVSLSENQVKAIYKNETNTIVSNETFVGDEWICEITPNDGIVDGIPANSTSLTILLDNYPPSTPTSLLCDGGLCTGNFSSEIEMNCSGSTDNNGDEITYFIEKGDENITYNNTQAWDSTSETGDSGWANSGNTNRCFRDLLRGTYIDNNGSAFRLNFVAGTDNNLFLDNVYICERDVTDWDCTGTYQQIQFGGLDSTTIASSGNTWTDWINFTINESADYYVTFGIGGGGNDGLSYKADGATGATVLRSANDGGIADCDDADWSAKGLTPDTNLFYGVEFMQVNESINNGMIWTEIGNHSDGSTFTWDILNETVGTIYENMQCRAIDISGSNTYSSYYSITSNITIEEYTVPPPTVSNIGCYEVGVGWENCTNLVYGETLDLVRASCTPGGLNGTIQNASFVFRNIDDNKTYFNLTTSDNSSGYFEINVSDIIIADSGGFSMQVYCRENPTGYGDENWSISYGTLSAELISPNANANATKGKFFNFTAQITCSGGECGEINASLDPGFPFGTPSNGTADDGRITDLDGGDNSGGAYTDTQSNNNAYYGIGEITNNDDTNSQMELDFNISNIGINPSDITNLSIYFTYCHSGENDWATFIATGCDGDDPIEKTISGDQDFWIYDYNTLSWIDIGNLNTANGELEVTDIFSATGTMSNFVSSGNLVTIRTEIVTTTAGADAWLAVDEAVLEVLYEGDKGELVSTVIGANPFYTTSDNPQNSSFEACLGNMQAGSMCNNTWEVNATGPIGTKWLFYTLYDSFNYSQNVSAIESSHINITILGNFAPNVTSVTIIPANPSPTTDLNCSFVASDANTFDSLSANVSWYQGGTLVYSEIVNAINGETTISTLNSGNTSAGQTWICGVTPSDEDTTGYQTNSTSVDILNSIPPTINSLQCQEEGLTWGDCSNILFGNNLTAVRVDCPDPDGYVLNATFTLTNIEDSKTFFSNTTTENSTGYFVFDNEDIFIQDSGTFNLTVNCIDNSSSPGYGNTQWEIPWGTLEGILISPFEDGNVTKDQFFNFTSQITCVGGECGDINATLDPFEIYDYGFETGTQNWTHYSYAGGADDWHRSTEDYYEGNYSWKFGDTGTGTYSNSANGALISPVFDVRTSLGNDAVISFYHWMFAESGEWDVGIMEYSVDGGAWTKVPSSFFITGGYNGQFSENGGAPVVNFTNNEAAWTENIGSAGNFQFVQVNFSSLNPETLQVQFRFGGDDNTAEEGWYIDNVSVSQWTYTKSIIPMNSGIPFYTITQNPATKGNFSCLANMKPGDSCNTTWVVNASGVSNKTYTFFSIYESWNYSNFVTLNETEHIKLTIIDNLAPEVESVEVRPTNPISTEDLVCNFTVYDSSALDTLTANVSWYVGGAFHSSSIVNVNNGVPESLALGSDNTSVGETWICGVTPYDQFLYGNQVNSTEVNILLNLPPDLSDVQCYQNNAVWTACDNLGFNDNFSGIRVNCTSDALTIDSVTVNFSNTPDNQIYFDTLTTDSGNDWWYYYQNITLNNSGEFIIESLCTDNESIDDYQIVNWSLPWGVLSASQISPGSSTSVGYHEFFTFTSDITCSGGECGDIEALLDPGFDESNPTSGTPDAGRVEDIGNNDDENGDYTDTQTNNNNYYSIGKFVWGDVNSLIELDFNVSNVTLNYAKNLTFINLTMAYCHSGENSFANFEATNCDGDDPIEKTFSGDQDVWIYNYVTDTWVDIGNLDTTNAENEVVDTWAATGTLSEYINNSEIIRIRTELVTGAPTNANDALLAIEEANLTLGFNKIKGGGPVSTVIGDLPFYTNDSNPYNWSNYNCLSSMIDGSPTCEVSWNVNATGEIGTTHEFWVIFNSTNHNPYITDEETTHIYLTIANLTAVPPEVTLNSPEDYYSDTLSSVQFNCSATDNVALTNMTLYGNFVGAFGPNETDSISGTSASTVFNINLAEGQYLWNCLAYDSHGNSDFGNANRTITIDQTAASINLNYPVDNATFSSGSVEFNFTTTDNLDSSLLCNLTIDSVIQGGSIVALNNTPTLTNISGVTQGDHLWNVTCYDDAGNANTSLTRNFSISDLAPTVELITLNNFSQSSPFVTFQYNATDNNNVTLAELYINGILNASDSSVNNGQINTFLDVEFAEGIYNWTVNVSDISSLTDQAPERVFSIDWTAPNIIILEPENNYFTNSSNMTFNFSVVDNLDESMLCNITINGIVEDSLIVAANATNISRLITNISDGENLWNVTCIDDAGNLNTSETRMLNVSNPPNVQLFWPEDNYSHNDTQIELMFFPTDNGEFSSCQVILNGVANETNSTSILNGVQNNITILDLEEGYYDWTVNCTDSANNSYIANPTRNFSIDITNPNIDLHGPASGDTIYSDIINFNFTATDNMNYVIGCNLTIDGVVNKTLNVTNATPTNTTVIFDSDATRFWNVTCWDDAGNTNTSETWNFTNTAPPVVTLITLPNGSLINYSQNINLTYYVSDSGSITNTTLFLNGVANETQYVVANKDYNSFYLNLSIDGEYNWTVQATDNDGLMTNSTIWTFLADTTAPIIVYNNPSNGNTISTNNVTFNFTAYDNLNYDLLCNVSVGGAVQWNNISATPGETIIRNTLLNDGTNNWSVSCTDSVNLTSTYFLVNFTVIAPPNVILNSPISYVRDTEQDIIFNYTPQDAVGFENCSLYYDSQLNQTDIGIEKNIPNYFNITNVPNGLHNWTVECYDQVPDENIFTAATEFFVVDILGPNITLIAPTEGQTMNSNDIDFNWTATDFNSSILVECNLTLDDILNVTGLSEFSGDYFEVLVENLTDGPHNWSVECMDDLGNGATSITSNFTVNQPDIYLDDSRINFNNTNPSIGETINITANVSNIGGLDANNVNVSFWDGNPATTGVMIGSDIHTIVTTTSQIFSVAWTMPEGLHTIYVSADPANDIGELNESNNNGTASINAIFVNITYPQNNTQTTDNTPNIHFNISDYTGGNLDYDIFVDGSFNGQTGTIVDASNTSINLNVLTDGIKQIIVQATDVSSRMKNSTPIYITVDTTGPSTQFQQINASWFNNENVTIIYNLTDQFSTNITYNVFLDGTYNESGNTTSGLTNSTTFIGLPEGLHSVIVEGTDELGNAQNSTSLVFFVDFSSPVPNITTANYSWFNADNPLIDFLITDNLDLILDYSLFVDDTMNVTGTANNATPASDNLLGLADGAYDVLLEGLDSANNSANSSSIRLYIDTVNPNVTLNFPLNDTNLTDNNVELNFTPLDSMAEFLICNVTLDGSVVTQDINVTNATMQNSTLVNLNGGYHYWNVTCFDTAGNQNTSDTWRFYIELPDIYVNSSKIIVNESEHRENQTINISAVIENTGTTDSGDFVVQFWNGNPETTGTQINGNITMNITAGGIKNASVLFNPPIGTNEIYVVADAPTSTNGTLSEENEANNIGLINISVSLWHYAFGTTSDRIVITDAEYGVLFDWGIENASGSNLFVIDSDSDVDWTSLQALGRDISNASTTNDFEELDLGIGAENFSDNVNLTYTVAGSPTETTSFIVYDNLIANVPVTNSTNNTNFKTGILWDTSDYAISEFNGSQDVAFITEVKYQLQGYNDTYDYEIRMPATLRDYLGPNNVNVDFYIEIK